MAILASTFFGLGAIQNRKGLEKSSFLSAILVVTIVGNIIFWFLVFLLVPLESVNPTGVLLFILAGVFAPGLARLTYFKGMDRLGASLNASLNSISPLFSSIIAVLVLSEYPTIGIWIGMPCIIIGGILLQGSLQNPKRGPLQATRKDILYPLLCSFFAGLSAVIRKMGLNVYGEPLMGVGLGYLTSLCIYVILLATSRKNRSSVSLNQKNLRLFGKAALFMCGAWLCSLYALRYGQVIVVTSLLNIEPVFVLLFTHLLLKRLEKVTLRLTVGTVVTLLGVLCITTLS